MNQEEKGHSRRHFTPQEKVNLIREHLLEGIPISTLCEKHKIIPSQFYLWQKTFFENGTAAFESERSRPRSEMGKIEAKAEKLEAKLKRKDEVIAQIMGEYCQLKKELGES